MSLPLLFAQPQSADDWSAWGFNHAANHYDWITAAQIQKPGTQFQDFLLNPIDPANIDFWLYTHQAAHNQINSYLGTQGYDLLALDVTDPDQFQEWLLQNGDEHQRISKALGVG